MKPRQLLAIALAVALAGLVKLWMSSGSEEPAPSAGAPVSFDQLDPAAAEAALKARAQQR